jgi:hypothetical protein
LIEITVIGQITFPNQPIYLVEMVVIVTGYVSDQPVEGYIIIEGELDRALNGGIFICSVLIFEYELGNQS